jgi:hypothetical protein
VFSLSDPIRIGNHRTHSYSPQGLIGHLFCLMMCLVITIDLRVASHHQRPKTPYIHVSTDASAECTHGVQCGEEAYTILARYLPVHRRKGNGHSWKVPSKRSFQLLIYSGTQHVPDSVINPARRCTIAVTALDLRLCSQNTAALCMHNPSLAL